MYTAAKQAPAVVPPPPPLSKQAPVKEDAIQQLPSDAPTALIGTCFPDYPNLLYEIFTIFIFPLSAPDDYCHIFAQAPKDVNEKK